MLITFKSRADADVIMFGEVARRMLAVMGKDPHDTEGIITEEQLPAALAALRTAAEQDRREHAAIKSLVDNDEDSEREREARISFVGFAQRAVPLQTMLEYAIKEGVAVQWESSGSMAHT